MIKTIANLNEEEYMSIPNRKSVVNEFYRYEFTKVDTKGDRRVVNISLDVYGSISSHHALELATGLKAKKDGEHKMQLIITEDHSVQTMTYFHNLADAALMGETSSLKAVLDQFMLFIHKGGLEKTMIELISKFHLDLYGAARNADSCLLINKWFQKLDSTEPLLGYPPTFTIFELFHNHRNWGLHSEVSKILSSKQSLNHILDMMNNSPIGRISR